MIFLIDNQNSFTIEFWLINALKLQSPAHLVTILVFLPVLSNISQLYAELVDSSSVGIVLFFMFCAQFYVSLGRRQLTGLLGISVSQRH